MNSENQLKTTLAFVHTPKTGGSSIRETYRDVLVCANRNKINKHSHLTLSAITEPYDVSFGVVREPKEWMHSLWYYTFHNKTVRWLNEYRTFESFVLNGGYANVEKTLGNNTQTGWLEGVDRFILFDDLENGLNKLLEEFDFEIRPLKKLKVGGKKASIELSEKAEFLLNKHLRKDYILYNRLKRDQSETR